MKKHTIRFIADDSNFITIQTLERSNTISGFWGGEWIKINLQLEVGSFTAHRDGTIVLDRLCKFGDELKTLHKNLDGKATFSALEGWFEIKVTVNKLGHLALSGFVCEDLVSPNKLIFEMHADQTFLNKPIQQLSLLQKELKG